MNEKAKAREREELNAQVEAFLKSGGKIKKLPTATAMLLDGTMPDRPQLSYSAWAKKKDRAADKVELRNLTRQAVELHQRGLTIIQISDEMKVTERLIRAIIAKYLRSQKK